LARGRTTFLITHDLQVVARADEILFLDAGRILERGTHAELMEKKGRYAQLYLLQAMTHDRDIGEEEPIALERSYGAGSARARSAGIGSPARSGGLRRGVPAPHAGARSSARADRVCP